MHKLNKVEYDAKKAAKDQAKLAYEVLKDNMKDKPPKLDEVAARLIYVEKILGL